MRAKYAVQVLLLTATADSTPFLFGIGGDPSAPPAEKSESALAMVLKLRKIPSAQILVARTIASSRSDFVASVEMSKFGTTPLISRFVWVPHLPVLGEQPRSALLKAELPFHRAYQTCCWQERGRRLQSASLLRRPSEERATCIR